MGIVILGLMLLSLPWGDVGVWLIVLPVTYVLVSAVLFPRFRVVLPALQDSPKIRRNKRINVIGFASFVLAFLLWVGFDEHLTRLERQLRTSAGSQEMLQRVQRIREVAGSLHLPILLLILTLLVFFAWMNHRVRKGVIAAAEQSLPATPQDSQIGQPPDRGVDQSTA
jgi:uncharacterized membrane protein YbaN (DUF454 family)